MLTGNKPRRQNGNRYPPTDFLRRNAAAGPDAVRVREKKCLIQKNEEMNEIMLFLLLCALGALCYGFYFKCVDWFEKI